MHIARFGSGYTELRAALPAPQTFLSRNRFMTVSAFPSALLRTVCAVLSAGAMLQAQAEGTAEPFAYPTGLLDASATLTEPVGRFARLGKPVIELDVSKLADAAALTDAARLREGHGAFSRDMIWLTGTENGKPLRVWLIATGSERSTEVQIERAPESGAPKICRRLPAELLPVRLGRIGLGMTRDETDELLGPASHEDRAGWRYWFCQQQLRSERGLQSLRLNWLAVRFDEAGKVVQAFISQVTNL